MHADLVMILIVLVLRFALPAAVAAAIAVVAYYVARRKSPQLQGVGSTEERLRKLLRSGIGSPEERLQKLGQLRQQNLISDAEYEQQRQRIIASV